MKLSSILALGGSKLCNCRSFWPLEPQKLRRRAWPLWPGIVANSGLRRLRPRREAAALLHGRPATQATLPISTPASVGWEFRGLWWLNPKRQWFGWLRARSGSGWGEAGTRAKNRARGSAAPLIYAPLTCRHHHTTSLWRWWWRHVPI